MKSIKPIGNILCSMDAVYIVKGINGGKYRGIGLLKNGAKIIPYESTHERLASLEQAYHKTSEDILPKMLEDCDSNTTLYTNNKSINSILNFIPNDIDINVEDYYHNKYTHTKYWDKINQLWRIAFLFGFDERYMCKPEKAPKGPYTIYTDASLWEIQNKASIGFVVIGSNGGMYSAGFPTPKYIQDNNIAECYAILSALKSLPKNAECTIHTDSSYAINRIESIQNAEGNIIVDIKKELSRLDIHPIIKHVSRELTFMPDILADVCKDNPWLIGQNPRL